LYHRHDEIVDSWNCGDRHSALVRHYTERELITLLAGLRAQRKRYPRSHGRMSYRLPKNAVCLPDATGFCHKPDDRIAFPDADVTIARRIAHDLFGDESLAFKYMAFIDARTRALVRDNWSAIERVACALIERDKLNYHDVLRLTYPTPSVEAG
jgi:hypothetical protein